MEFFQANCHKNITTILIHKASSKFDIHDHNFTLGTDHYNNNNLRSIILASVNNVRKSFYK